MSSFFNSISKNFQTGQIDLSKFPVLNENIGTIIKQVFIGGFFLFIGIVLLTINLVNKQINIHNKNTNNNHAKATVTNEVSPTIAEQNYEQNGNFGIGHMSDGNINQGAILAGQSNQTEIKKLQETIKELQTKLDQLANNSSSVN